MLSSIENEIDKALIHLLNESVRLRSEIWKNISENKVEISIEDIISIHGIEVYEKWLELSYLTKHIENINS